MSRYPCLTIKWKKQAPSALALTVTTGGFSSTLPIPTNVKLWSVLLKVRPNLRPTTLLSSSFKGRYLDSSDFSCSVIVSSESPISCKSSTISMGISFTSKSPHGFLVKSTKFSVPTSIVLESSDDSGISVLDTMTICDLIGVEVNGVCFCL